MSEAGAFIQRIIGPVETLMVYDTLQFDDYSKYMAPRFDPAQESRAPERSLSARLPEGF